MGVSGLTLESRGGGCMECACMHVCMVRECVCVCECACESMSMSMCVCM